MKYTLTLPVDQVDPPEEFCTAEAITQMAQAAEAAGFDEMRARIELLREEADKAGRKDPIDIGTCCFSHQHHPRGQENYDPPAFLEEVERMAEIGVTWISVKARSPNRKVFLENIARWGEEVISKAKKHEAATA